MKRARSFLFVLGFVSTSACGADPAGRPPRLWVPADQVADSFGLLEGEGSVAVLGRVVAATLSPSGRYLAVSDAAPPFIRMLDRETGTAWAFGARGEGPGELGAAWGTAFVRDSLVVLSGSTRLDRFTVHGQWLDRIPLTEHGLVPFAIASGCGDRLFLYGVPVAREGGGPLPWLHALTMEPELRTAPLLELPGAPFLAFGARYGLDASDAGVFLWHRQRQSGIEAGYWIPCPPGSAAPRLLESTPTELPLEEALRIGGTQVMSLTLPDTLFAGAASVGEAALRAFSWWEHDGHVTRLRLMSSGRCAEAELWGAWTLHGLEADLLVLARSDPFPAVHLVRWRWLASEMREVRCDR